MELTKHYIEVARVRALKQDNAKMVGYYSDLIDGVTIKVRRTTPLDVMEEVDEFEASYTLNRNDKAFMIFGCVRECSSYGFDLTEYIVKAIKENIAISGELQCGGYTSIREKGNPSYRCQSVLEFQITPHLRKL